MRAYLRTRLLGWFMSQDIKAADAACPPWDAEKPDESLQGLADYVEQEAKKAIAWYYVAKRRKAKLSYVLRFLTILCTALGGLIPILVIALVDDGTERLRLNQWGYFAVGLAAFWLAWDRFAGSSSGWMRYITTAMALETLLEEFRHDWRRLSAQRAASATDPSWLTVRLERIKAFALAVRGQVEKETQAWAAEFQSTLAQLEKEAKQALDAAREQARKEAEALEAARRAAADAQRAGAVEVTVESSVPLDNGFTVEIDATPRQRDVTGKTCGIAGVPPGLHEVVVKATAGGKPLHASRIVTVEGNQVTPVTIVLR